MALGIKRQDGAGGGGQGAGVAIETKDQLIYLQEQQ